LQAGACGIEADEAGASSEHPRPNGKSIGIVDDTVAPLVLFLII
jgi:hypothetical protein